MKIRCVIVDDEAPARDELRYLLSRYSEVEVCGEADSAGKAISVIKQLKPNLAFLDIQMPGRNGFEVIQALAAMEAPPVFVFVTAFDNYAVKAFEESAVDYILKPISEQRLATTVERVGRLLAESDETSLESRLQSLINHVASSSQPETVKISVEKNGRMRLLAPEEIVYCSYREGRIHVHTFEATIPLHGITTMDRLEGHLAGSGFFRAHRSVLVNLNFIREFSPWFNGKYSLIMADREGSELAVSRSRVKAFKERLAI
ncbi:LytR/AlgR family response regulator transcription factor [Desulfogranum mediterraneum]|uniref:LytR/AlgR family response regulator transcription factor n=1 Tax=Desulfogranum mediterraneum TaxID=160661 RepID=UPI00041671A0|nr:LytTR family DNA-binding domain-containing protein [Desulfogranum mediterraneum]